MNTIESTAIAPFANLLATAQSAGPDVSAYEKQEELIAQCRAQKQPFLASMPLRNRFRCPVCFMETGEVQLHFEDPGQALPEPAQQGMWGRPAGRFADIDWSALHAILIHGHAAPAELTHLLSGARPVPSGSGSDA